MTSDTNLNLFFTDKQIDDPAIRATSFLRYDPSLSDVFGAFTQEMYEGSESWSGTLDALDADFERGEMRVTGPLSLYKKIEKHLIGAEPSRRMTKDEWVSSEYFRDGIQYDPKMTEGLAKILSETHDREQKNATIISRASGIEKTFGLIGGFLPGVFEPRNLMAGIGASVATGGIGGAATVFARNASVSARAAKALRKYESAVGKAGTVRRAVSEGLIGSAVLEPGSWGSADSLQRDYGMADTLMNVGLSIGISGAIQGGVNFFGKRRPKSVAREEAMQAVRTSVAQMSEGKSVDIEHISKYYDSTLQRETPPLNYSKEDMDRINAIPGDEGVLDFFWQKANEIKSSAEKYSIVDINNPKEVARALDIDSKNIKTAKQFLKESGGIVDSGGELKSRGITSKSLPGLIRRSRKQIHEAGGNDLSKAGMGLDDAAKRLQEAGYLPKNKEATPQDAIDALERDISGDRVYTENIREAIENNITANSDFMRKMDEAGIDPMASEEEIAKSLQEYYVENNLGMSDIESYIGTPPEQMTEMPEDIIRQYEEDYEEWRSVSLFTEEDPDDIISEADSITSDMNDIRDIEAQISELEGEIDNMRASGLLGEDDSKYIDEINETVRAIDEAAQISGYAIPCLTRT